jgi:leader peptidase (prepilin peptidase)/N-methyltransferase
MILLALRELRRRRASDGDPGLGLGDVKLFAGLALWLGAATPWALVAAASLGLVGWTLGGRGSGRIAFGPALAAGSWAVGVARDGGLIPWLA